MEVRDLRGKVVTIGSMVRYTGTGTSGEVSAVKVEKKQGWAKMNDSDLWYNTEYLEVFTKSETKKSRNNQDKTTAAMEKSKNMRKGLEEIAMGSELCDGGG
ncbi:DUF2098 domain-containing protein [Methanobacterium alkalithermotolerans]|uniref:DUF2098 domain-containing protein n=1 Tax=Methanobacterium alkalithermotolerans TaxID=2731220 RepID=A0A8T8K3A0_9EURY|nr:DUF2098 domain-containing protein [Methanobacterium alkalithermotolerans]QUH22884.1 DUF2098 domain-containing protein [Methanobacterium alkalithermotolerans]